MNNTVKPSKQTNNIRDKGTLILSTVFMLSLCLLGKSLTTPLTTPCHNHSYHPVTLFNHNSL